LLSRVRIGPWIVLSPASFLCFQRPFTTLANRPPFGNQQRGVSRFKVHDFAHMPSGQVDTVDALGVLLGKANLHCNTQTGAMYVPVSLAEAGSADLADPITVQLKLDTARVVDARITGTVRV
jgi:hypothetical protein